MREIGIMLDDALRGSALMPVKALVDAESMAEAALRMSPGSDIPELLFFSMLLPSGALSLDLHVCYVCNTCQEFCVMYAHCLPV